MPKHHMPLVNKQMSMDVGKNTEWKLFGQGDFPASFSLKMSDACFIISCVLVENILCRNANILLRSYGPRHSFAM